MTIGYCNAARNDYRAIEQWAQAQPDHPAAAAVLAAVNDEVWAVTLMSRDDVIAAYSAARAAGYYVDAEDRMNQYESDLEVERADQYLRALGY
jgi:hypothetical protein